MAEENTEKTTVSIIPNYKQMFEVFTRDIFLVELENLREQRSLHHLLLSINLALQTASDSEDINSLREKLQSLVENSSLNIAERDND